MIELGFWLNITQFSEAKTWTLPIDWFLLISCLLFINGDSNFVAVASPFLVLLPFSMEMEQILSLTFCSSLPNLAVNN